MLLRPAGLARFLVFGALVSFGCGSDSNPTDPAPSPVESATLGVNNAAAFGRVDVDGLPAPSAKTAVGDYLAVLSADGAEEIRLVLGHDDDGWHFSAPLHTSDPLAGGDLSVRISDGEAQSEPFTLTVGTLPEAPGAYAAMVAKVTEWIELVANTAGTTIAELRVMDPATMNGSLLPLRLAQAYLDSDEDDNDLTDLVTNSDAVLSADVVELLDRVIGYLELEEFVQLLIDDLEPTEGLFVANAKRSTPGCVELDREIDGAVRLSVYMTLSAVTEFAVDPDARPAQILSNGGDAMAVLGTAPGPVGVVATIAATSFATLDGSVGYLAGTHPTGFTSITCDIDRTTFNEDTTVGAVYSDVMVTAVSDGFVADRSLANVILNLAGGVMSAAGRLQVAGSDFLGAVAAYEVGVGANLVFGETNLIQFCPQEWTIDISDAPFQTAGVANRGFDVDIFTRAITPLEVGEDVLTIAAQPSMFGGRTIAKQIPLEVRAIEVTITPTLIQLENPGFPINFDGAIANADDPRLAWLPERGGWIDALPDTTQGGAFRTLSTPNNPDFYPFDVRVESISRGGLRESGVPARFAVARVELAGSRLEIGPAYACLRNGDSQQLSIVGETLEVTWEVTGGEGSIDANGLYTAPASGETSATIRAIAVEDPSRVGYLTLDVASCDCSIDIRVTGDSIWEYQGNQIAYYVEQTEIGPFFQVNIYIDSPDGRSFSASIAPGMNRPNLQPGLTGSFPAGAFYSTPDTTWWSTQESLVFVDKHTQSYMHGSFIGTAVHFDQTGQIDSSVNYNADFRALRYSRSESFPCD